MPFPVSVVEDPLPLAVRGCQLAGGENIQDRFTLVLELALS